jgi:hypothetical protein
MYFSAFCIAYYTAGEYELAAEWGRKALAENGVRHGTGGWTAASLAALGRIREARAVADWTMSQSPGRSIRAVVSNHPYRDPARRQLYGEHLIAAGFPD